ncbi:MAG: 50S ribosomal protein L24 [Flavobacteriales bacterium]|nr:50S ribosomal protein L24 [Flavobacteriales bacterium]
MAVKLKLKKGDKVVVISGEHKGQQGIILSVDREKNRATVEGVNMIYRHTKPSAQFPDGGIIKKEAPIHISNLMLLTPKNGTASRVGRKVEEGKIVRYAKKTGEILK